MNEKTLQKDKTPGARPEVLICLFLVVATLAVYWQVRNHAFVNFDDNKLVTDIPQVQEGLTAEGLIWAFTSATEVSNYWIPITWMSHMLDFELYGWNPGGQHSTSLLFHVLNTLLLFLALKKMTGAAGRSGFVAGLFALHPLHVESVAWIAERKDVVSTFFWFLAMIAYARYARRPGLLRYFMVLLLFVLGLMSKPMLVTFPFVLLLMDYWPLGRVDAGQVTGSKTMAFRKSPVLLLVGEKVPFLALAAAASAAAFVYQKKGGALPAMDSALFETQIANALVSYVIYIQKTFWPSGLSVFYPAPDKVPLGQSAGAALVLAVLTIWFCRAAKKKPYLPVGWFWYLGTLVPVIGLVKIGAFARADRYTYVPLVGLFVLIAWGGLDMAAGRRHWTKILSAAAGLVLFALAAGAWVQVGHWQSSTTLFKHALDVTDKNWLAHTRLGHAMDQQGRIDEAIGHYTEALRINPGFANAHNNLGTALARKGDLNRAVHHYKEALRINPGYAGAYYNLGKISVARGDAMGAASLYAQALENDPEMIAALYQLAWLRSTHPDARVRNGNEARVLAEKLCRITGYAHPFALDALAAAHAENGSYPEAVSTARQAVRSAQSNKLEALASGIRQRLHLYSSGRPYRQTSNREE